MACDRRLPVRLRVRIVRGVRRATDLAGSDSAVAYEPMRPSWATARRLLYGEIHEIGRTLLAMDDSEAGAVLTTQNGQRTSGVMALANGWPAAIGLAALTGEAELPEGVIPEALYRFFAEELYQAAADELQPALCELALVPFLSLEIAEVLFDDLAARVIDEAVRLGFLSSTGQETFDVHPLARAFLHVKLHEFRGEHRSTAVEALGQHLVNRREWDNAFDVLERSFRADVFLDTLAPALPMLLESGRLLTLERWAEMGRRHTLRHPLLELARAEIAFRRGHLVEAEALSLQAGREFREDKTSQFRAYYLAGVSAHLRGAARAGFDHHSNALRVARTASELRDALWGRLLSSMLLEEGDGGDILDSLERIRDGTPEAEVRLAHARLVIESQLGNVASALPDIELAMHLVPNVRDQVIRAGFRTAYAQALIWMGLYRRARNAVEDNFDRVEEDRLDFALPHVQRVQVLTDIGLGRFGRALGLIERIETSARATDDPYLLGEVSILRTRLAIAQGIPEAAFATPEKPEEEFPAKGEYGEYLALRALALASTEKWTQAQELAAAAVRITRLQEVQVLGACANALIALGSTSTGYCARAEAAFTKVMEGGHVDAFVCAYRARPELVAFLYRRKKWQSILADILVNAEDRALAKRLGLRPPLPATSPKETLSPRELEVLNLLGHGLSNKQMAAALYVTESTIKVHLRHIFEKLGVRSRMEAALRAASWDED
jgi:ATP/maltotriose-dependent transcriptional regulator MalT